MMRDVMDVTCTQEGKDKGKVFRITPMDAWRAEKWGWRAMGLLAKSGMDLPPVNMLGNLLVIASFGFEALLRADFEQAEPLLDEMMTCVQIVPDPKNPSFARSDIHHDVKELNTIFWLRDRVLEAHTDFSVAAVISNFRANAAARNGSPLDTQTGQPNTSQ